MSVLRLAIPSPLRRLFDYLPPGGMGAAAVASLQPGLRLKVPFGSRVVTGRSFRDERNSAARAICVDLPEPSIPSKVMNRFIGIP